MGGVALVEVWPCCRRHGLVVRPLLLEVDFDTDAISSLFALLSPQLPTPMALGFLLLWWEELI